MIRALHLTPFALAIALAGTHAAAAREVRINNAGVQRTAVAASTASGVCTAQLDVQLSSLGLACSGRVVTFGCDGVLTTKDVAWRMFDVAQLASVRKLLVNINVSDTRKAADGTTCFAPRIELVPPK